MSLFLRTETRAPVFRFDGTNLPSHKIPVHWSLSAQERTRVAGHTQTDSYKDRQPTLPLFEMTRVCSSRLRCREMSAGLAVPGYDQLEPAECWRPATPSAHSTSGYLPWYNGTTIYRWVLTESQAHWLVPNHRQLKQKDRHTASGYTL